MCTVAYMYRAGVGLWRQVQNIFLLPGHGLCHDLHSGVLPQALRRPGQVPGHSTNLTLLLCFAQVEVHEIRYVSDRLCGHHALLHRTDHVRRQ